MRLVSGFSKMCFVRPEILAWTPPSQSRHGTLRTKATDPDPMRDPMGSAIRGMKLGTVAALPDPAAPPSKSPPSSPGAAMSQTRPPTPPPTPDPASAPKRKRGRPRKDPAAKRDVSVSVSLNEGEAARLDEHRAELSRADYLRLNATRRTPPPPPVPAINRGEYIRLYQLEQALLACRAAQPTPSDPQVPSDAGDLRLLIEEVRAEVVRLRRALLGLEA